MENILIALSIGVVAGIIDVIPMLILKSGRSANLSAFFHWVFLGLIIPFVSWDIQPWLKGLIIVELAAVPVLCVVTGEDKKAVVPVVVMSAVLGIAVGVAGATLIF